jgi:hypothetical protein
LAETGEVLPIDVGFADRADEQVNASDLLSDDHAPWSAEILGTLPGIEVKGWHNASEAEARPARSIWFPRSLAIAAVEA